MAIAFRAATYGSFASVNDITVDAPSGLQDGDVVLVFIMAISGYTLGSPPSGWSQVGSTQDQGGTDQYQSAFIKVASSEGASWYFEDIFTTTETGVWACVAYSGVDNTTPQDVAVVQGYTSYTDAGNPHTAGPITPSNNGAMLVASYSIDANAAVTGTADNSPAATERVDYCGADPYPYIFVQDYLQATAAEVSLDAIFDIADQAIWFIVALRPAGGSGAALKARTDGGLTLCLKGFST